MGMVLRGWALTDHGQGEEGVTQLSQGLAAWRATGATRGSRRKSSKKPALVYPAEAEGTIPGTPGSRRSDQ